jgi:hypothetical protein
MSVVYTQAALKDMTRPVLYGIAQTLYGKRSTYAVNGVKKGISKLKHAELVEAILAFQGRGEEAGEETYSGMSNDALKELLTAKGQKGLSGKNKAALISLLVNGPAPGEEKKVEAKLSDKEAFETDVKMTKDRLKELILAKIPDAKLSQPDRAGLQRKVAELYGWAIPAPKVKAEKKEVVIEKKGGNHWLAYLKDSGLNPTDLSAKSRFSKEEVAQHYEGFRLYKQMMEEHKDE